MVQSYLGEVGGAKGQEPMYSNGRTRGNEATFPGGIQGHMQNSGESELKQNAI